MAINYKESPSKLNVIISGVPSLQCDYFRDKKPDVMRKTFSYVVKCSLLHVVNT